MSQLLVELEKLLDFTIQNSCVLPCVFLVAFFPQLFVYSTHVDFFRKSVNLLLQLYQSVMFPFHFHQLFFRSFHSPLEIHISHKLFHYFCHQIAILTPIHLRHRLLILPVLAILNNPIFTFSIAIIIFYSFPISFSCSFTSYPISHIK